jgi:hypothetical protein
MVDEGEAADPDPVFDADYVRMLLTEVRPDITIDEFIEYSNIAPPLMAQLLVEVQNRGEAAIYQDEWNTPIVCLTPLGAERSGVRLSETHPPIWVNVDGTTPPIIAAQQGGMVLFTDIEDSMSGGDETWSFGDAQADPNQLEPVQVLVNIEEMASHLLRNGSRIPKSYEFAFHGIRGIWPLSQPRRASPSTPSASTWQELFTRCPCCPTLGPDEVCPICGGHAPKRACPDCEGKVFAFYDLCIWCGRSGVDYLQQRIVPPVTRRANARTRPGGR